MHETQPRVVTLIAESAFQHKLIDLIEHAGAAGYWIEKLNRERSHPGSRAGTLKRERLIKLTTVVSPDVVEAIVHELTDSLLPAYGVKAVRAVHLW